MNTTTQEQIDYTPARKELRQDIIERSGQPIFECYACRRCAAGCPVAPETGGFTPDKLIRSILYGDKEAIFNNPLIWRCVSCFTCGTRCPNNIHSSKINETLKQIQQEDNLHTAYPGVAYFHQEFFKSAIRSGRLNEIDFLLRYQIRYSLRLIKHREFKKVGNELRKQIKFGNTLRKKKRLELSLHSCKGRRELKKIYSREKNKQEK
ncbi:MAG: 4Fe-4S dicluster domain-containing protein [Thermodesulfobacteriota bacterium]